MAIEAFQLVKIGVESWASFIDSMVMMLSQSRRPLEMAHSNSSLCLHLLSDLLQALQNIAARRHT
jgi:hypothetical protein